MQGCVRLTERLLDVASCSREGGKFALWYSWLLSVANRVHVQMTVRYDVTEEIGL